MAKPSQTNAYTPLAIALHWLLAVLILANLGFGLYVHGLHLSPLKLKIINWHKWAGVTIFALALLRLGWRTGHRPPALPVAMPVWQRVGAHAVHGMLYVLMLAVPVTGWLMSSAKGFQTVYFGVLPIPDLLAKDKALGDALLTVHAWLNYLLLTLVAGHAAMALKHHLIDRDDILVRMAPWFRRNKEESQS